jgi:hypothetical protein
MRALMLSLLWLAAVCGWTNVAAAQQLAPPPNMRAGGLAPPASNTGPAPPASTAPGFTPTWQQLEEGQSRDSGRGLEFVYFNVDAGMQLVSLGALSQGALLADGRATSGIGGTVGVGAGARLLYFTVGPRFQYAHFADWNLWTLNLELGWHIPLGRLEPYAMIGGGYAKLPRAGEGAFAGDLVSVSGFDIQLGGGFDYYLSTACSVGAMLDARLLRLSRSAVPQSPTPGGATITPAFGSDASSVGLALTGAAVLGLHY